MKTAIVTIVLPITLYFGIAPYAQEKSNASSAANISAEARPTNASESEAKFEALLTDALLSGRWAPLKDGELGEEKGGDKYNIVSAVKSAGDLLALVFTPVPHAASLRELTRGSIVGDSFVRSNYNNLSGSITAVPEPSSLVPLAGGIGWLVFGLARRFGKKSAIH